MVRVLMTGEQIEALGSIVEAVNGRIPVFLDGGVRSGTDVVKALALGAKAVFLGRPVPFALTYNVSSLRTGTNQLQW